MDEYGRPIYGDVFGVAEEVEQVLIDSIVIFSHGVLTHVLYRLKQNQLMTPCGVSSRAKTADPAVMKIAVMRMTTATKRMPQHQRLTLVL